MRLRDLTAAVIVHINFYLLTQLELATFGDALNCVQCDRGFHHFNLTKEEARRRCMQGLMTPTPCYNTSATHCIVNFFRKGIGGPTTVTMRSCGFESDAAGCTLYRFPKPPTSAKTSVKAVRRTSDEASAHKSTYYQTEQELEFLEVCAEGCTTDGCLMVTSGAATLKLLCKIQPYLIVSVLFSVVLLQVAAAAMI